ncbi:hypothetical protein [Dyadobacter sp. 676]|uniref:Uncharacterized protein n=1 Tax=Dyadobacter sp. 676 TaxID=3088362 RepID=A0AAU8FVF0_9BACT
MVLPLWLWVHFKGSPFFLQKRPGLNGKLFYDSEIQDDV